MQRLDNEEHLTVGMVTQGNAASDYEAGWIWEKIEKGSKLCLQAIFAVALAICVLIAGYFLNDRRFLPLILLLLLAGANVMHALGLFYLRQADSLYGKYRLLSAAWIMFTLSIVLNIAFLILHFSQQNPVSAFPAEFTLLNGILSLISHSLLLLGLLQNRAAAIYSNYRSLVWTSLLCMLIYFGTTTGLVGASLDPAVRENLLRITEQRTLVISIGAGVFTIALIGLLAYAWALYRLQQCARLSRMMFGNFDFYKL